MVKPDSRILCEILMSSSRCSRSFRRRRKLLLHREELTKISHKIRESGFTIVPLQLYFVDGRAKVEIGVARGKKEYDKRQTLREQQDKREAQRVMRERNRR